METETIESKEMTAIRPVERYETKRMQTILLILLALTVVVALVAGGWSETM